MSKKAWLAAGAGVIVAGLIATGIWGSRPTHWPVTKIDGVDKHHFHTPFFGDRTITQEFTAASDTLSRIEVLVVDFKRQASGVPLTLELRMVGSDQVLRSISVDGHLVRDDYYLPFAFEPLPTTRDVTYSLTLAAPAASADAPYAVRRAADNETIAFSYSEHRNNMFVAKQWVQAHRQPLGTFFLLLAASIGLAWLLPWSNQSPRNAVIAMAIVLSCGVLLQISVLRQLVGSPGGDDYYYLVAAKQLSQGLNPLADWSYRLPFYPLLLLPAVSPSIPDLEWGRALGIVITTGLGFSLLALTRYLRVPAAVAVAAMALLYSNTDWLITSVRPRPYHLFSTLLLLTTVTLFAIKTTKHAFWWGVLLGIMGMTRQEAFLPTAILGLAFAVMIFARRLPRSETAKYLLAAAVPLVLITAPYFYANYRDQGSPFSTTAYTSRSDLFWPATWHDLWAGNLVVARNTLGAVWLPSSSSGVRHGLAPFLGAALAGLGLLYVTRRRLSPGLEITSVLASAVIVISIGQWLIRRGHTWSQEINMLLVATLIAGPILLIRTGGWRGMLVVGILVSQLSVATLFHPAAKHYQQTFPLLAFGGAALLLALTEAPRWWQQSLRALPLVLLLGWLGTNNLLNISNALDAHNYQAAPFYVTTAAAEELEQYPQGSVAAEVDYDSGDGMYRLHSYQQRTFTRFDTPRGAAEQVQWLCDNNIRYVVDHGDLSHIHEPAEQAYFKQLFEKKAMGRDDRRFAVTAFEFLPHDVCNN